MVDFNNDVLIPAQKAEQFVAETGGLPEITRAATDLRTALEQTHVEIRDAVFADRFPMEASDWFQTMTGSGNEPLSPRARDAIATEGEAGHKRTALQLSVEKIEHDLFGLIAKLVETRCDLIVSQQEFEAES